MRRTAALVAAFVLVHVWLAVVNLYIAPDGMGDVYSVYRGWMETAFGDGNWVGLDQPWVYPIVALVPIALPFAIAGSGFYPEAWLVSVALIDLVALIVLIAARQRAAGWAWTAFLFVLGPIAVGRIDAISVPLVIIGLTVLARRPLVAGALIVIATWIKVWPAAVLASVLVAVPARLRVLAGVLIATAVIVVVTIELGGGPFLTSFISQQTDRGLQIEAPVTTPWMWAAVAHLDGAAIYFDYDLITYQVTGTGVDVAAAIMNPLLAIAALATLLLGVRALRRHANPADLVLVLSTALVTCLIVFNKVGSPQYIAWLAAPLVLAVSLGIARYRVLVIATLLIAALTQFIYPYLYFTVIGASIGGVALLTARNLLLVALFVWAIVRLVKLGSYDMNRARKA